ncbi:MAG: 3-deoxy-manno-octulosonate cytidylyltransferase [Chloroflexi bacterium]|nr:3-deoxy-manno-octulosonate cytidylyltransferase [Chloroflexota bacterium]
MKTVIVIPARLASTRLPRKVLADICGKPLIQRVWERVQQARLADEIVIATDSQEVAGLVEAWGGKALMTDPACQSGTERIASLLAQLDADLILNVQGDEPLVDPDMLDALVASWKAAPCDLVTPVYRITSVDDLFNPNIVKVVRAADGRALYFSRSPVPYVRDVPREQWLERQPFWGHIGVYGYSRAVLAKYVSLPASPLQQAESLEQLRFLEAGYSFQTVETSYHSIAVDTQDDLEKVRRMICG